MAPSQHPNVAAPHEGVPARKPSWTRNPYVWVAVGACVLTLGVVVLRETLRRERPQPLQGVAVLGAAADDGRSEERRVGKECCR